MKDSPSPAQWVRVAHPRTQAKLRLFCLSYGGGEASLFARWPRALPPDVQEQVELCAIELPGRAHRIYERPLYCNMSTLIEALVPPTLALSPLYRYLDKPFAFFGVDLGGLISFELVRRLASVHQLTAAALCVAATRAPHLPASFHLKREQDLTDGCLLEHLRTSGGIPEELLINDQLMKFLWPKLHADSLLSATYRYVPGPPLSCPVTALGGKADPLVSPTDIAAWQTHTTGTFRFRLFDGGHFFVRDTTETTRKQILNDLAQALRPTLQLVASGALVPLEAVS